MDNWLFQCCMCDRLRSDRAPALPFARFSSSDLLVLPGSAVGNADDHINILVLLISPTVSFTASIGSLNKSSQVGAQASASLPKTPTTAMSVSPFPIQHSH